MGIQIRIGPPYPLLVVSGNVPYPSQRKTSRTIEKNMKNKKTKNDLPCHCRCCTLKNTPCSNKTINTDELVVMTENYVDGRNMPPYKGL
jgi:hypothetical protein